jgi:hypothetical protein
MARVWVNHVTIFWVYEIIFAPFSNRGLMVAYELRFGQILSNTNQDYNNISNNFNVEHFSVWRRLRVIYLASLKIVLEGQILGNSEFHHNEGNFLYLCKFLHNKIWNKKLYTCLTISRLVPVNIIKLTNNKEYDIINYKVCGCILHASMEHDERKLQTTRGRGEVSKRTASSPVRWLSSRRRLEWSDGDESIAIVLGQSSGRSPWWRWFWAS